MAELRALGDDLGLEGVATVLNSGNLVFTVPDSRVAGVAAEIEAAVAAACGFSATTIVVRAEQLACIVAENPLLDVAADSARLLVAFVAEPGALFRAQSLFEVPWAPEAFAVGAHAAYLWCADGVIASPLAKAFAHLMGESATMRNWTTVGKVWAAVADRQSSLG